MLIPQIKPGRVGLSTSIREETCPPCHHMHADRPPESGLMSKLIEKAIYRRLSLLRSTGGAGGGGG